MKENIYISGFADEISPDFTEQLKTVTSLGMHYISLRSADGKNIAEYTPDEVREKLMPRLAQYGVKVSSIGSPVGKVGVEDEAGFAEHLAGLERLCEICKLLDCRYIRMFSFFIPHGKDPDSYRDVVIEKLRKFAAVAEKHDYSLACKTVFPADLRKKNCCYRAADALVRDFMASTKSPLRSFWKQSVV